MIFVKFMSKIFWTVLVMLLLVVGIVAQTLCMFVYLPYACGWHIIKKEGNIGLFFKDFKEQLSASTDELFGVVAEDLRLIWRN